VLTIGRVLVETAVTVIALFLQAFVSVGKLLKKNDLRRYITQKQVHGVT
jgi:hypothetical protein